ncbi:ABC transporter ATP-binding protein [Lachnospiraceae bacterium LCP25S3_G4]
MQECIYAEGLSKYYHNSEIVKSIQFKVDQGQIFTFLGPNGAGKSTTMNMVGTLLEKTKGTLFINGENVETDKDAIKRSIGIVFQDDVLDDDLTVYKNLLYRGALYWKTEIELKEQIKKIVNLLAMNAIQDRKYKECSGGQKRLAQIARALLPNPKLLILDEPTTGLDPVTRKNVWNVLLKLKDKLNMTIVYTTHYLDEAAYADTICILKDGRILTCGSLKQIQIKGYGRSTYDTLEALYFQLLKGDGTCVASSI